MPRASERPDAWVVVAPRRTSGKKRQRSSSLVLFIYPSITPSSCKYCAIILCGRLGFMVWVGRGRGRKSGVPCGAAAVWWLLVWRLTLCRGVRWCPVVLHIMLTSGGLYCFSGVYILLPVYSLFPSWSACSVCVCV